ncbi:AraC family transcriptional regulator [Methylobacterium sp. ID0610]|uniref:AraC family transcriptional regulator n=1 Tax=Methylobacterium carpenticola TaxID=3344827 RepID=UPI0036B59B6E
MDDPGAAARPLARYSVVDTRDPDAAREQIGRIFCPHRLLPIGPEAAACFDARHHSAPFGPLLVNYVAYGAQVTIDPGCLGRFYLLQVPLGGSALVASGGHLVEAGPARATLLSPTVETRMTWAEGCEKLIVLVPRSVMEEHLARLLDQPPRSVAFDPAVSLADPRGSAILAQARLLQHLVEERPPGAAAGGVLERELASSFVTMLLGHALVAGACGGAPAPASTVAPAHVRRAEEYIRAHLEEALTLPHLARQAGSSIRTLQEGFRQFRNTTISDFILAQRLDRWRALIRSSTGEARVGDLAFAVGLNHLGRAAAAYRERFGESPSQTRAARRG